MTKTKNVTNFAKIVLAKITGDKSIETAERNFRKADSALSGQIAALNSRVIDLENALEDSKESYENAKYPTELIGETSSYLRQVKSAKETVDNNQSLLDEVNASLKFYKELQAEFNAEVTE